MLAAVAGALSIGACACATSGGDEPGQGRRILEPTAADGPAPRAVTRSPAEARPRDGRGSEVTEVARLLVAGATGDAAAAARADELARVVLARFAHDPVVLAYAGGARALQARYSADPFAKLSSCNEGLELLDRAVAAAPEGVEVRYVRMKSTFTMPGFLGRGDQNRADLAWLLARVDAAVAAGMLTERMGAVVLLYAGIERREAGQITAARDLLQRAAALAPDGLEGARAREELGRLAGS